MTQRNLILDHQFVKASTIAAGTHFATSADGLLYFPSSISSRRRGFQAREIGSLVLFRALQLGDMLIPFPGHPLLPELPVREDQISLFYRSVRSRHFDLAVQLHGSGEITNPIVAAFGARTTAGFLAHQGREHPVDIPVLYPRNGPEPLRLLRMASALTAYSPQTHLEFPLTCEDWSALES